MQLTLTPDEAIVLHTVVERYLDQLRTDSGQDESIRSLLDDEQQMLIEIQVMRATSWSRPSRRQRYGRRAVLCSTCLLR